MEIDITVENLPDGSVRTTTVYPDGEVSCLTTGLKRRGGVYFDPALDVPIPAHVSRNKRQGRYCGKFKGRHARSKYGFDAYKKGD